MENKNNKKLTIVIVNWNGYGVINNCLQSIDMCTSRSELEVIVVDNGSTDGSVEMIEHKFPKVIIIKNKQNQGFGKANNIGIALAQTEFILLLNSDTVVKEDTIKKCLSYMMSNNVGVVGCRVEFPDGRFQSSYFRYQGLMDLFLIRLIGVVTIVKKNLVPTRYWGREFKEIKEVDVIAGCFFLIRKEVVNATGVFDEDFFMYGEEEEWCWRIKKAGWKIVYYPHASILHFHGYSSKKASAHIAIESQRAPLLVLHKTRGVFIAWIGNFIIFLGLLLRVPFKLTKGIILKWFHRSYDKQIMILPKIIGFHLKGIFMPVWKPSVYNNKHAISLVKENKVEEQL